MVKHSAFFNKEHRPEDDLARQRDVEALLEPRHTFSQDISLERIFPNPFQARQNFEGLDELAEGIRVHGFISRLRVRPDPKKPGNFQLVFGERRLRAARLAGLKTLPCDIAEHSDDELIEIGLIENIQRQNLAPLEEAEAFYLFTHSRKYTVRGLAQRIGKDKSYVDDRLALLKSPKDVQEMLSLRPDTVRVAREISRLPSLEDRRPLIKGIIEGTHNTEQIRFLVRQILNKSNDSVPQGPELIPASSSRPQTPEEFASFGRDSQRMFTIMKRWRQKMKTASSQERAVLLTQLSELMDDLHQLKVELSGDIQMKSNVK